jgi:hypothetical protein
MAAAETRRGRGRPEGSKSTPSEIVETIPASCPHCGSTERHVLCKVKEMAHGGNSPSGHARTHIVWRRCRCDLCRGYFVEMSHENRG